MADVNKDIVDQLERTNKLIAKLEDSRYLQMIDRPHKFLWMSFMQGVAVALGSTVGVAVVLTVLLYTLRKLEVFTPLSDQLTQIQQLLQQVHK